MERERISASGELVRCLDCGTVYRQPESESDAGECPTCGYVGWITLRAQEAGKRQRRSGEDPPPRLPGQRG
jgi:predicted  nucleic acid-binding Zn-ribbon protein